MIFSKIKGLMVLLIFTMLCSSCGSDEKRTILNSVERKLMDSVYSNGLKEARIEADRLCVKLRDSLFQEYVDSILELRLIEVDQIINE